MVAHRAGLVALADHVIPVPAPVPTSAEWSDPDADPPRVEESPPHRPAPETPAPETPDPVTSRRVGLRLGGGAVLGALAAASGVALTATAGWLIARAAEHPPVLMLMVAIVGVRTFGLARPALRYAERLVSHDVALRLLAERRAAVYDSLVPLVPGRIGKQRGDVLASVVDDVDALVDKHLRVRAPLTTYALVGLMAVGFTAWVLPAAALVTLGVLVVGGTAAFLVSRAGVARAEERFLGARGRLGSLVVQTLQGAPDLLLWQAGGRALDEVDAAGRDIAAAASRSVRSTAAGRAVAVLTAGAGVATMAWVGAGALAAGTVSEPMLALLVLLPLALLDVTGPLADAGALQVRAAAADRRLATLAGTAPAVTDPQVPVAPDPHDVTVRLDGVSVGWSERAVLDHLDLDLPPGARIGVVGPSGCGKSTLAAVLLRFLDPWHGTARLGPVGLGQMRLDDVRRSVGLVDDDPHVFSSTLRENIRLARPDASTEEIRAALGKAQLGDWVDRLPRGLDTLIGDGHAHVSGGERARIGLARAVLADQPVLVLDEPTAHLDTATARAVTEDLLAAGGGRSVVWITHGTVGLDRMDRVLDLDATAAAVPAPAAG